MDNRKNSNIKKKKTLTKYLPDETYPKYLVNKYKKTSKIEFYPNDGTHGLAVEKTEGISVDTKEKVGPYSNVRLKVNCVCCSNYKKLDIYYSTEEDDDFIEIGGVFAPRHLWLKVLKEVLRLKD